MGKAGIAAAEVRTLLSDRHQTDPLSLAGAAPTSEMTVTAQQARRFCLRDVSADGRAIRKAKRVGDLAVAGDAAILLVKLDDEAYDLAVTRIEARHARNVVVVRLPE